MKQRTTTLGWWHSYFTPHPKKGNKEAKEEWFLPGGKFKVYCSACYETHIKQIDQQSLDTKLAAGIPTEPETLRTWRM